MQEQLNTFIPNKVELEKNSLYLRKVVKIPVEDLYETFYPAPFEKYVSICVDNAFNFWNEVIELLIKPLTDAGIGIILLTRKDEDISHDYAKVVTCDTLRQYKSLINRAEVHISAVDWSDVLCRYNHILLQDQEAKYNYRPSYTSIIQNDVNAVEKLAQAVLDSINIDYGIMVDTLFVGENYGDSVLEIVPDTSIEKVGDYLSRARFVAVRLDLCENYRLVLDLLKFGVPVYLYINKPIRKELISALGDCVKINIVDVKNFTNQDIFDIANSGVPLQINSWETKPELIAETRNAFFDWEISFPKEKKNLQFLTKRSILKTSRYILSSSGLYVSTAHFKNGISVKHAAGGSVGELLDNEDLLREIEYFYIYDRN